MNKTTKYKIVVAAIMAAAIFSACGSKEDKVSGVILMEEYDVKPAESDCEASELEVINEDKDSRNVHEPIKYTVYVCGAVNNPGVYDVYDDARIIDAIEAAGGMLEDAGAEYLNLASSIKDGQKIYVPTKQEIEEAIGGNGTVSANVNIISPQLTMMDESNGDAKDASGATKDLVNINTADATTLMTLPGIGQSKADKIIAYRQKNGGFNSIEDIMLVGGIKEGLFNKVKDYISVD